MAGRTPVTASLAYATGRAANRRWFLNFKICLTSLYLNFPCPLGYDGKVGSTGRLLVNYIDEAVPFSMHPSLHRFFRPKYICRFGPGPRRGNSPQSLSSDRFLCATVHGRARGLMQTMHNVDGWKKKVLSRVSEIP